MDKLYNKLSFVVQYQDPSDDYADGSLYAMKKTYDTNS